MPACKIVEFTCWNRQDNSFILFIRCSCIFWVCPLIQVVVYRIRRIFLPLCVQRYVSGQFDFFLVFVGFAGFVWSLFCAPAVKIKVCFFRKRRNNFCAESSGTYRFFPAVVRVKCQCYDFFCHSGFLRLSSRPPRFFPEQILLH